MPVKILGFQIERKGVSQQRVKRRRDFFHRGLRQVGRCIEVGGYLVGFAGFAHVAPSCRKFGIGGIGHCPPDHLTHQCQAGSRPRNPRFAGLFKPMDEWIDYYDSTHTIYASKLHRDLHFEVIARDIIGYISSPDAVVLDYACGEALSAARVADACAQLYLAEPAPGVRGRLIARFAPNTRIRVRSLEDLTRMAESSIDLVV